MQEYTKRSRNGDAGEYLAAFKFTKTFGWPYRMLDVDLGVDAEIEILDGAGTSTSDLVKLQIKTFDEITTLGSKKIYVSDAHISYWKRFCVPIVVVCVDLKSERVYWTPVSATECYRSGGTSSVISIDLAEDELTAASASKITALVTPDASKRIEELLISARQHYRKLTDRTTPLVDRTLLEEIEGIQRHFEASVSEIDEILRHFPWKAGVLTQREISLMTGNARMLLNNARRHYAEWVHLNGG